MNDGETAVASKEDLHAALLSGKRLLALWNALPGVEKRRKIGDREALIDQLWLAIEALPDPELEPDAKRPSKQDEVIAMLQRPEGATLDRCGAVPVLRCCGRSFPAVPRLHSAPRRRRWKTRQGRRRR